MSRTIPTNEAELQAFLMPKIEIIVQNILDNLKYWNKREINWRVYNKGKPEVYKRTYEFRDDAWDGRIADVSNDTVTGEFEYLPNRITTVEPGVHASIFTDYDELDDIRPYLAEIIYEGLAGRIFGTGFWTEKRDAWSELLRLAKVDGNLMKRWITAGARKAGLNITW